MSIRLTRSQALNFYCLARQAERSIDFALHPTCPWDLLRDYYLPERLARLESALEMLRGLTSDAAAPISRDRLRFINVWWVLSYWPRVLINRIRSSWHFEEIEVQFFVQTLQSVANYIRSPEKQSAEQLVETRMDLHHCETIVGWTLAGLPILE